MAQTTRASKEKLRISWGKRWLDALNNYQYSSGPGGVRRMLRASESLRELRIHLSTETRISRGKRQRATFAGHRPGPPTLHNLVACRLGSVWTRLDATSKRRGVRRLTCR